MVFSIGSGGVVLLIILFKFLTLISKFKSRRTNTFIGVLSLLNGILAFFCNCLKIKLKFFFCLALLLAAIITIYTTLFDRSIRFIDGNVKYSWSYWLLYGSICSFFVSALFLFCTPKKSQHIRLLNNVS